MNNAEKAYNVLRRAATMRPDRKDISCSLFMAQRRYGIWNVRAVVPAVCVALPRVLTATASGLRRHGAARHRPVGPARVGARRRGQAEVLRAASGT